MGEILANVAVVVVVLGVCAWITALVAGRMYLKCPACRTLNAHRRTECRTCGETLRP